MKCKKKKTVVEPLKGLGKFDLVWNKTQNELGWNIAIDLGTERTKIVSKGVVLADEPSVVAYDMVHKRVVAVGKKALEMYEKTPKHISFVKPVQEGNIDDIKMTVEMLRGIIKTANAKRPLFWRPNRMVICTPVGINKVEQWAACKSGKKLGARTIKTIPYPIAVALGAGIDVNSPNANLIVVIGGGATDIATISMGGIISGTTLRIGGETFNDHIVDYLKRYHNLFIGCRVAEEMRNAIGAAVSVLEDEPAEYNAHGRDLLTGLANEVSISFNEVAQAIDHSVEIIVRKVLDTIYSLPPQIVTDIAQTGILLAGEGAHLRGLDKRIETAARCKVRVIDNPSHAAARGAYIALDNFNEYPFLT